MNHGISWPAVKPVNAVVPPVPPDVPPVPPVPPVLLPGFPFDPAIVMLSESELLAGTGSAWSADTTDAAFCSVPELACTVTFRMTVPALPAGINGIENSCDDCRRRPDCSQ